MLLNLSGANPKSSDDKYLHKKSISLDLGKSKKDFIKLSKDILEDYINKNLIYFSEICSIQHESVLKYALFIKEDTSFTSVFLSLSNSINPYISKTDISKMKEYARLNNMESLGVFAVSNNIISRNETFTVYDGKKSVFIQIL